MPYAPDLLLANANIITMDPARPRTATVAVAGGRIAGVGDDAAEAVTAEEALRAYPWGPHTRARPNA